MQLTTQEIQRASALIQWLEVLCNGRVRPDDPTVVQKKMEKAGDTSKPCCNETGVIRDSYEFQEDIKLIRSELRDLLIAGKYDQDED